jgi:dinuclear metal center YbgI/SA1388 family protein
MPQVKDVIQYLETIAPLEYQESYDNAGLIVGNRDATVVSVLLCLDSTEAVIDEAIAQGSNLVIAHHPIVFSGLKQFTGKNYIERVIIKAIKNDIAIYAIHTNLDNVYQNGVNKRICDILGLENTQILSANLALSQVGDIGAGMIGNLPSPMITKDFLLSLKDKMSLNVIKHTKLTAEKITRVAVCGGSGSFLLDQAIAQKADIFITSDYKYHQFFDANDQIIIADIGHYESEFYTIELLQELIRKKFSNFAAHCTKISTNPVNYL